MDHFCNIITESNFAELSNTNDVVSFDDLDLNDGVITNLSNSSNLSVPVQPIDSNEQHGDSYFQAMNNETDQSERQHQSFIVNLNEYQNLMNNLLLNSNLLPSQMPLTSIYLYYCKPNPLRCLIQYLRNNFASTLESFYIIDSMHTLKTSPSLSLASMEPIRLIPSSSMLCLDNLNPDYTEFDYQNIQELDYSVQSPSSSICSHFEHNLRTVNNTIMATTNNHITTTTAITTLTPSSSDLDVLSCDSIDFSQFYADNLNWHVGLEFPAFSQTSVPCDQPINLDDLKNGCDEQLMIDKSFPVQFLNYDKAKFSDCSNRIIDECGPNLPVLYSPNCYKSFNDLDPDPFVMFAWRCKKLRKFTMLGNYIFG